MARTMTERPTTHPFTRAEYHRMAEAGILGEDDRVELIEGAIIDMTPIGSRHAGTVKYLTARLGPGIGQRAILSVQDPVALGPDSEPEPDLALLRPRADCYRERHPMASEVLLVIEVAGASLAFDREIKLPLYARHGIPEAWLVDLVAQRLVRYRRPGEDGYGEASPLGALHAVPLPAALGGTIELSALFGPTP